MVLERELPAYLDTHPEVRDGYLVTSENAFDYCLPGTEYVDREMIAPELFIPQLKPSVDKLYARAQTASAISREKGAFPHTNSNQLIARQRRLDTSNQRDRSSVEYSHTVLYNPYLGKFDLSDITEGTDYEVHIDIYDLMEQGMNPIIPEHTHPDKSAAVKALLVLCPDVVILEFATKQTPPPISEDEVIEWLEHWNNRYKNEDPYQVQKELEEEMGTVKRYSTDRETFRQIAA